ILYHHVEYVSNLAKRPKWEKTIRKAIPIVNSNNSPIYFEIRNRQKVVNDEEELLSYFLSILNHFRIEHGLSIVIDKSHKLIVGRQFETLQRTGLSKLRKIRHRYFSDMLKKMYKLCELYFTKTDLASSKK